MHTFTQPQRADFLRKHPVFHTPFFSPLDFSIFYSPNSFQEKRENGFQTIMRSTQMNNMHVCSCMHLNEHFDSVDKAQKEVDSRQ